MYIQPYILAESKYMLILLLFFEINIYKWVQAFQKFTVCHIVLYYKKSHHILS